MSGQRSETAAHGACGEFRTWTPTKMLPTPPSADACGNCGQPEWRHTKDGKLWFADHPEYEPAWDVARHDDGTPITITPAQGHAITRALMVLKMVEEAEGGSCGGVYSKSRLLGRMLYEGLPPTKTKPPSDMGAPWWGLLPGGDPFQTADERAQREAETDRMLAAGTLILSCHVCGYSGPTFTSRAEHQEHVESHATEPHDA